MIFVGFVLVELQMKMRMMMIVVWGSSCEEGTWGEEWGCSGRK